jgi:asparagine N-glycosylation enzyme membrane subunit Stt3
MPRAVEAPQPLEGTRRRLSGAGGVAGWLLLFAGALAVRALRFGLVATPEGVRFPSGADELYHARRVWFTAANFPASLDFDRYMNHPIGAPPIWPPFFDWTIGAVARAFAGGADQAAVERVAIWAPPLLGALAVLAAAALLRRTFSPSAGWVTGAWLAVLPAHVTYGSIGELDHHVAVGLFVIGLLAAAMRLLSGRLRSGAVASGVAMAAALLLWPGALLHVLVVQAAWAAHTLAAREPEAACARARALAAAHALAAALVLPFCAGRRWPELGAVTPLVLSSFQPLWLGAGAAAFAALAALWRRTRLLGGSRARRAASALGLVAIGLAFAWLAVPGLADALRSAAGWFTPDPFLAEVAELEPLLERNGRFAPALAHHYFSFAFWAFPLAAAALAGRALRAGRADVGLLVAWASVFAAAALHQQRFMDAAGLGFALVVGPAAVLGFESVARRFVPPRAALLAAAAAAAALALLPYAPAYRGDWLASRAALRGERLYLEPLVRQRRVVERVAAFLRQETPPTAGYLDPAQQPEWGVLAAWGHGHLLRYRGERPMVQDNFGPWGGRAGFEAARAYYESASEEDGYAIAARLGARYVVAAPRGSGQRRPKPGTLATRLALRRTTRGTLAFADGRALARHRLVFVADDTDLARAGEPPWTVAVYEMLPGAEVTGRALAGSSVRFELPVALAGRRPVPFRASARAGADGRYALRLPQPSAGEPYLVAAGDETARFALGEADVREGRRVAGPNFGGRAIPPP